MSESKLLTDVEIKERGGVLQGGISELSDEQVDAVAGGFEFSRAKSFQGLAYDDIPQRLYGVNSSCYDGCQLPPERKSLWARSVEGPDSSTKIDVKCYNCEMLYDFIIESNA